MPILGYLFCILMVVMVYVYYIYLCHPKFREIQYEELRASGKFKTGDIILFHALDNINPIFMGCYYGHIGVVFVDPDDPEKIPYLFEAASAKTMPLLDHHNKNGIFLTPMDIRMRKYSGFLFYKELSHEINPQTAREFKKFIEYAQKNMYYEYKVVQNCFKKGFLGEKPGDNTNCGEITMLSLIKLGLLDYERYNQSIFHHLKWMCYVTELDNEMHYKDPICIIDHPF